MIFLEIGAILILFLIGAFSWRGESQLLAFFSFGGLITALWYFGYVNIFAYGIPGIFIAAIAYLFVGVIYARFILWPDYLERHEDDLHKIIKEWNENRATSNNRLQVHDHWKENYDYKNIFSASRQKSRIMGMIAAWPWDIVDIVTARPVEYAYKLSAESFSRAADRAVDKMAKKQEGTKTSGQ